jgi:hypothetical protein
MFDTAIDTTTADHTNVNDAAANRLTIVDIAVLCNLSYITFESILEYETKNDHEQLLFTKIGKNIKYSANDVVGAEYILTQTIDLKTIVITVRGTDDMQDVLNDMEFLQCAPDDLECQLRAINNQTILDSDMELDIDTSNTAGIRFHKGIYDEFLSIYKLVVKDLLEINPTMDKTIVLSGHSSGAGVCSMIAYYIINYMNWKGSITVVSIASPRFTNYIGALWFMEHIPNYYRLYNSYDPVVSLPPQCFNYRHVFKNVIQIKGQTVSYDITYRNISDTWCCGTLFNWWNKIHVKNHSILEYINICGKLLPNYIIPY